MVRPKERTLEARLPASAGSPNPTRSNPKELEYANLNVGGVAESGTESQVPHRHRRGEGVEALVGEEKGREGAPGAGRRQCMTLGREESRRGVDVVVQALEDLDEGLVGELGERVWRNGVSGVSFESL